MEFSCWEKWHQRMLLPSMRDLTVSFRFIDGVYAFDSGKTSNFSRKLTLIFSNASMFSWIVLVISGYIFSIWGCDKKLLFVVLTFVSGKISFKIILFYVSPNKIQSNLVFWHSTPTVTIFWMSGVRRLRGVGRGLHGRHWEPNLLLRAREVRRLEVLVRHLDV